MIVRNVIQDILTYNNTVTVVTIDCMQNVFFEVKKK